MQNRNKFRYKNMKKHLYIKLTTLPSTEDLKTDSLEFELFKDKYGKDFKTEEKLTEKESYDKYYSDSSKTPLFGKIYNITIGYQKEDDTISTLVLKGNEKSVIQKFLNIYNEDRFKDYKTVLWNSEFTLPFITTRASKNEILSGYGQSLMHYGLKSWNLKCLDLQSFLKGVSWFSNSLKEWAYVYNLPTDFINGEDVYSTFKSDGGEKELDNNSINEIVAMINIHRKSSGEQPIENVTSNVVEIQEEVKEEKLPILQRIYKATDINSTTKKELEDILKKKKMSKKDRVIVEDILSSLYVNSEMFKADSKEVKEQKKQEIKELLDGVK